MIREVNSTHHCTRSLYLLLDPKEIKASIPSSLDSLSLHLPHKHISLTSTSSKSSLSSSLPLTESSVENSIQFNSSKSIQNPLNQMKPDDKSITVPHEPDLGVALSRSLVRASHHGNIKLTSNSDSNKTTPTIMTMDSDDDNEKESNNDSDEELKGSIHGKPLCLPEETPAFSIPDFFNETPMKSSTNSSFPTSSILPYKPEDSKGILLNSKPLKRKNENEPQIMNSTDVPLKNKKKKQRMNPPNQKVNSTFKMKKSITNRDEIDDIFGF